MFFLSVMGFYIVGMVFIGYLAGRRVRTMEDYLIAGRRLPIFLAVPTIVATFFGAGSCMGVSGTVYSQGYYGVLADPFGCSLTLLIAGLFYAAPFRRLRLLTVADLLGKAYGPRFERVSTILMLPLYVGTLASQMLAMGYVFHLVSGASQEVGILLGSLVVVIYTVSGGMWAVTVTDFIQFSLLVMGLLILLPVCFEQVPDTHAVRQKFFQEFITLLPAGQPNFDWLSYSGRILMTGLGAIMGQDLIQRCLASRSESVARSSAMLGGLIYFLLGLIPLYIGLAGRDIFPHLEKPELLMPLLAQQFLSPLAFALFACGLLSAIMSTADSYLLAGTSLLANNVLLKVWHIDTEKNKIFLLRVLNVTLAITAFGLAMSGPSIFDMMVHSGATLFVAVFVPASAALFWRGANRPAAWTSLLVGLVSWIGYMWMDGREFALQHEDILFSAAVVGWAMSLLSYLVVSVVRSRAVVHSEAVA